MILVWLCAAAPAYGADVTVDGSSVTEGDAATTTVDFTITLTSAEAGDVTIGYQTLPGLPADPEVDFTPQSGEVTFAAGETVKTVPVPVVGDTVDEPTEYILMEVTGAANVAGEALATILDNDATISIGDVLAYEGSRSATFTVTVSSTDSGDVGVTYGTGNGTAFALNDYTPQGGTLSFAEFDALTQTIPVPITNDGVAEPDETFRVVLTDPVNGRIADDTGEGTIRDGVAPQPPPPPVTPDTVPDDPVFDDEPTAAARVLRGLSLVPSKRRVSRNSLVRLSGVLRATGGPANCRSRQKIAIQRRQASGGRFQTFEVAVTGRSGSFRSSTRPVRTYVYRARVSQTARCMGATSKVARVAVKKRSKAG